ncbi:helix-turn-helix transcriptional regulator [Bacillus cereus]|uniref:helix-turn-helix domain-containing protein n=1 Tax=Bacillus cereus TaxID=1396 RepID=UPI002404FDA0|nr:helix-turn-helix transcriptional regulator [Bacillus cereus]MDF9622748.1 helix-turn-helix transcriptional regulator [Bacillus cereus]
MGVTEIIKQLCQKRDISVSTLEKELGFGQNTIYQWKKRTPSVERVQKVAEYFDVSIDYLLGRTKKQYWELTEKDEKDIQKQLEALIEDMSKAEALAFSKDSEPMSEETKRLLILSLENSLRLGKEMAKKKFTPKKYRNEE